MLFGSHYWEGLLEWIRKTMLAYETISAEDLKIITVTDDLEEVVEIMHAHREWKHGKSEQHAGKVEHTAPCSEDRG